MNKNKWEEIRLSMYNLGINMKTVIKWRTKDVKNGYISNWDGEWYYHFKNGGYETIEWLEISTPNSTIKEAILNELKKIHILGKIQEGSIMIYGYPNDSSIFYL